MTKNENIILNDPIIMNRLHITEQHTGKMEGMGSMSTSALCNERCIQNKQDPESVCNKCYAIAQALRYANLSRAIEKNFAILTSEILTDDLLPYVNFHYFRFEAFGDIANEIHFINYLNICFKNPNTKFAIWTKNPDLMATVFNEMGYKKPKNLEIVVSSLYLNVILDITANKKRYWFIDKIFTVFTMDYALKHNIIINCGNAVCFNCRVCYEKQSNEIIYINEIEKSEQKSYYEALEILQNYHLFITENEMDRTQETINLYISSLYYDLKETYMETETDRKKVCAKIKKHEKKIKSIIQEYYSYYEAR